MRRSIAFTAAVSLVALLVLVLPGGAAAKTECPSGHPYDEGNTYVRPSDGARLCRECTRARGREAYRRRMASRKQAPPTQPTGVRALDRNIGAADARELAVAVNGRGIDRIVPIGQALQFSRHWDGYDLFAEFTRQVTIDVDDTGRGQR